MRPGNLIAATVLAAAGIGLGVRATVALTEDRPAKIAAAPDASTIVVEGYVFPATVRVTVGGTLTWANNDDEPHTVRFANSTVPVPNDITIRPGETGSITFPSAGTFDYMCDFHRSMKGRVEVIDLSTAIDGYD